MQLSSPAKINLHLRVGAPAADGFHPILSWMCTTSLSDTLDFAEVPEPGIHLTCNRPDLKVDQTNLIVRAGEALCAARRAARGGKGGASSAASALAPTGARINLTKNIPMGGGLGGGSSNAAFTLLGLNQLWNLNFPIADLAEIGAALGSDVPFFFQGASSVCTGRGQFVVPISRPRPKYVVLIFPRISMPTPRVYQKFDELELGSDTAIHREPDWARWSELSARDLLAQLINDLEAPAFALNPFLGEVRLSIERSLHRIVRMSGSGSTLFTLFDEADEAEMAVHQLGSISVDAASYELAPTTPSPLFGFS